MAAEKFRDLTLEEAIPRLVQRALRRQRHEVVEAEPRLQCANGLVEQADRRRGSGGARGDRDGRGGFGVHEREI